ncbi:MAG: hypothetical protein AB1425_16115 [Actinomycetota bacterium]
MKEEAQATMRKVPPSVTLREQINQTLFSEGLNSAQQETDLLSTLARLGLSYLLQQALEQEQEDFLGRGHYERRKTEGQELSAATATATRMPASKPPRARSAYVFRR